MCSFWTSCKLMKLLPHIKRQQLTNASSYPWRFLHVGWTQIPRPNHHFSRCLTLWKACASQQLYSPLFLLNVRIFRPTNKNTKELLKTFFYLKNWGMWNVKITNICDVLIIHQFEINHLNVQLKWKFCSLIQTDKTLIFNFNNDAALIKQSA